MEREYTTELHQDDKETLVQVGKQLFKLVPIPDRFEDIMRKKETPHIRSLNSIPMRSKEEQRERNKSFSKLHNDNLSTYGSQKITSIKKAMKLGANVPEEIKRLLELKKKYNQEGNIQEAKSIRRQLRALDYKRYITEE